MRWRRWTGSLQQGSLAEGPGGLRAATEQVLSAQALTEANVLLSKAGQYFILFSAPQSTGQPGLGGAGRIGLLRLHIRFLPRPPREPHRSGPHRGGRRLLSDSGFGTQTTGG